jgi:PEP-CTERM motif
VGRNKAKAEVAGEADETKRGRQNKEGATIEEETKEMKRFLSKGIVALGALVMLSFAGTSVRADTFTYSGINTGVTGRVDVTQLTDGLLSVTITNTSNGTITGKITSIGFDLPGSTGSFTLVNATNPNYRLITDTDGNASGIHQTFELALLTGSNFNGGGNPNRGIVEGASATFTIAGNFTGFSQQLIAQGIFLRYQDVNTGGGSDVAKCTGCAPPPEVPEPATMVLLGTGLAGIAGAVRRRRKAAAAAKAEVDSNTV